MDRRISPIPGQTCDPFFGTGQGLAANPARNIMQSFDDKVDAAVHAAFMALGLSVASSMTLAMRLNDFITQEFRFAVTDDDEDDETILGSDDEEQSDAE